MKDHTMQLAEYLNAVIAEAGITDGYYNVSFNIAIKGETMLMDELLIRRSKPLELSIDGPKTPSDYFWWADTRLNKVLRHAQIGEAKEAKEHIEFAIAILKQWHGEL